MEMILMAGSGSCPNIAMDFNRKHGKNITHDTLAKLIEKFKKTGSVTDQPRYDEGITDVVLAVPEKENEGWLQKAV
jgi:hypothetical protein